MEKQHQIETIEAPDFSVQIDRLNSRQKKSIIQKVIIPLMNIRGGRKPDEFMTTAEIHEKLTRPYSSEKPGENDEFFHEVIDKNRYPRQTDSKTAYDFFNSMNHSDGINNKIASEIADNTYYGLQPNAEGSDKFGSETNEFIFEILYGIPKNAMLAFCLIKYSTRLKYGDNPNYKDLENEALQKYLDIHPELTNLWNLPDVPIQQYRPGSIRYHVHEEEYPE